MMKRKVFVSILLLALVFSAIGIQAFAADPPQNPPYRVRLFAGNSDVGVLTESQDRDDLGYGDPYTFDASKVNIVDDDDRYYVKGFREAGKDNSNGLYADTYNSVERDMDFVVAYGMKGSAVAYTVNFVDANEAPLAASRTLYANVGDKPIVSYIYIEGYEPQAYALTKTLTENPGDNVFNFTYTEIEPAAGETVVVEGGGGGAPVIPVGGNAGANPAQPAAPAQPETIIDLTCRWLPRTRRPRSPVRKRLSRPVNLKLNRQLSRRLSRQRHRRSRKTQSWPPGFRMSWQLAESGC